METTKKRKWSSAEPAPHPAPQIGLSSTLETGQGIPSDGGIDIHHSPRSTNDSAASPLPKVPDNSQLVSVITRKPTACPACRKQKVGRMNVAASSPPDSTDAYIDQMCYDK